MTYPAILFGIIISTLYGSAFHFWRGGGIGRLVLYLIFGWIGFWLGHGLGSYFEFTFDMLGPIHLGSATVGSLVLLLFGYWLSLVEIEKH
jgi:uncharacterized membrane protein YeaQ/YmgE (transglycosylase-associated protein family)